VAENIFRMNRHLSFAASSDTQRSNGNGNSNEYLRDDNSAAIGSSDEGSDSNAEDSGAEVNNSGERLSRKRKRTLGIS